MERVGHGLRIDVTLPVSHAAVYPGSHLKTSSAKIVLQIIYHLLLLYSATCVWSCPEIPALPLPEEKRYATKCKAAAYHLAR